MCLPLFAVDAFSLSLSLSLSFSLFSVSLSLSVCVLLVPCRVTIVMSVTVMGTLQHAFFTFLSVIGPNACLPSFCSRRGGGRSTGRGSELAQYTWVAPPCRGDVPCGEQPWIAGNARGRPDNRNHRSPASLCNAQRKTCASPKRALRRCPSSHPIAPVQLGSHSLSRSGPSGRCSNDRPTTVTMQQLPQLRGPWRSRPSSTIERSVSD